MATSDRWTRAVTSQRGKKARVYEREPGGLLQLAIWVPGQGEKRVSLSHRDKSTGLQTARAVLAELDRRHDGAAPDTVPSLTLDEGFRRFVQEARHLPDGSLKTGTYLRHVAMTGTYLVAFFGKDQAVAALTPDRIQQFVVWRRAGGVSGKPVGGNTIQRDLAMLKAVLNWACTVHEGGRPLLDRNPLDKMKFPREKDPKRPILEEATIERLLAAAAAVHPLLRPILVLARRTGRRLSAILHLRWDDLDFEAGVIRWRAEHDKVRRTWSIPMHTEVRTELLRFRKAQGTIGSALLFPHPLQRRHPGKPVTRHLAAWWLKEAFRRGNAPKPAGSLWHMFRRVWATERKHLPPKDVAAAGGWLDIGTLQQCYQQPDSETLRAVVEYERPRPLASKAPPPGHQVGAWGRTLQLTH